MTGDHGEVFEWQGRKVIPTIHPSAALRAPEREQRQRLREMLIEDLRAAKQVAESG